MILDYINGLFDSIILKLIIIFFTWLVVLVAVGIDLVFGIKKSKKNGEFTHSFGLRQTVQKVVNYLAMMLFMLLFDSINPLGLIHQNFNVLPLASVIGCLILTWIEFISVREKSDQKYKRKIDKVAKELIDLAMTDDNIVKRIKDNLENKE